MKKISVITLQNVRNYGSVLQALATQAVLEKVGKGQWKVDFFNYYKPGTATIKERIDRWTRGFNPVKKLIYTFILRPSMQREEKVFGAFLKKYVNVQETQVTISEDFKKLTLDSDIYCSGSDQTWNSKWNDGVVPELFLSFVPDNIKKIAYAGSFGKSKLDEDEVEQTKQLISRYDAISVREDTAVDIVNGLGKEATLVLDPTLQVTRGFWLNKFNITVDKEKSPYVLVYQLNTNKEFDKYAKEFAKRKGLRLVRFCIRHYQMIRGGYPVVIPPVEDFVRLIANAKYVITDSFHATAFSLNLHTDMVCIYPHEFGGRISSILKLVGLPDRHLKDYNDFSLADAAPIDFEAVDNVLNRQRIIGENFLSKAIWQ